ncbi:uncharacterized protein BDCG_01071 [Blastomyces dermatitidis ER-3]|uniref:Uncharacterized protein n=1 Tax=Ajellomyces dermatitidis (strain ER-3 / ATCC MYA-2586) TaxID=559297 RepID=A0ABP2EMV4_AJEDR|nr:uncharacterized protein BDCG_01071 [Blastomyces dermatitidis ER-3]EEQ84266.2 hypothetical protein BDCG_01071 [Blastomyces dermatitidis ER-3]
MKVYTGDFSTKVEDYETVRTIMINEAEKQFNVNLINTAYIPNFHTNIITDNTIFAHVEFILHTSNITISEKMISSNSTTSTNSSSSNLLIYTSINYSSNKLICTKPSQKPKISIATQSTWYKRLEHSSKNAIIKLVNDTTSIQITYLEAAADELITELCNLYQLSNAENQISRRSHVRSYTLYSTPEPTSESAGSNVNTGSNVDTGLNIDINTQPAAIANCTQNTDVDINTYSAVIDNRPDGRIVNAATR